MDCEGGRKENRQKYKVLACHQYSTVKHFLLKILVTFAHFWPVAKTPFLALEFLPNLRFSQVVKICPSCQISNSMEKVYMKMIYSWSLFLIERGHTICCHKNISPHISKGHLHFLVLHSMQAVNSCFRSLNKYPKQNLLEQAGTFLVILEI